MKDRNDHVTVDAFVCDVDLSCVRQIVNSACVDGEQLQFRHDNSVRHFDTGATRSSDADRYDPEGYLSPLALERFCLYMSKHQHLPDGSVRASDNWQKGIPLHAYMKAIWRHTLHLWLRHRGHRVVDAMAGENIEEDLCALLFNVQGMLHELLKERQHIVQPHKSNVGKVGEMDCVAQKIQEK